MLNSMKGWSLRPLLQRNKYYKDDEDEWRRKYWVVIHYNDPNVNLGLYSFENFSGNKFNIFH